MKARTDYEKFEFSSHENRRLLREEELILEVTIALAEAMERAELSKSQLAAKLGKSPAFVTQILAGGRNLTLRTVADVADALGSRVTIHIGRFEPAIVIPLESKPISNWNWCQMKFRTDEIKPAPQEPVAA